MSGPDRATAAAVHGLRDAPRRGVSPDPPLCRLKVPRQKRAWWQMARLKHSSCMSSRRSHRMHRRFTPWYQAMARFTTHQTTPSRNPQGPGRRRGRGSATGTPASALIRYGIDQRQQRDVVVAVSAGQDHGQRNAAPSVTTLFSGARPAHDGAWAAVGGRVPPVCGSSRWWCATSPACPRGGVGPEVLPACAARRRPRSHSRRRPPSGHSRAEAELWGRNGYRCPARTGSRTAPADRAAASGPTVEATRF